MRAVLFFCAQVKLDSELKSNWGWDQTDGSLQNKAGLKMSVFLQAGQRSNASKTTNVMKLEFQCNRLHYRRKEKYF